MEFQVNQGTPEGELHRPNVGHLLNPTKTTVKTSFKEEERREPLYSVASLPSSLLPRVVLQHQLQVSESQNAQIHYIKYSCICMEPTHSLLAL